MSAVDLSDWIRGVRQAALTLTELVGARIDGSRRRIFLLQRGGSLLPKSK